VLAALSAQGRGNECWNAERFEGVGNGPRVNENTDRIRHANCFVGEFSSELPDEYFDYVVSVSVIEHVPTDALEGFFADQARVLRPGGQMLHAIDLYLHDHDAPPERRAPNRARLRAYRSFADRPDLRLRFREEPVLGEEPSFRCAYASNSDLAMNQWNKSVPALQSVREQAESVTIKAE
jgi:SAM-dependent methyltransferase